MEGSTGGDDAENVDDDDSVADEMSDDGDDDADADAGARRRKRAKRTTTTTTGTFQAMRFL